VLPKLRSGEDLRVGIEFIVRLDTAIAPNTEAELRQILGELGVADSVRVDR
jgi:hypothetical protein